MTSAILILIGAEGATLLAHEAGHAATAAALRLPWRPVLSWHGPGIVIGRDDLLLAPWQLVATAAGGPFANLLLCAAAFRLGQPLLILINLEFAVINLLPFPRSDGARMLHPARTLARARAAL